MREIEGKHFYEISDYFNQIGYKPQITSIFTPENIFGIYRKMKIRKLRLGVNVNRFYQILVLKQTKILKK